MEKEKHAIKLVILRKLIRMKKIGGAHTELKNLILKGLSNSLLANKKGKKIINKAIKDLIQNGILLTKPSTGEIHVSINPRKLKEINKLLSLNP